MKKDKLGLTIKDYKEFNSFLKKLKEMNTDIEQCNPIGEDWIEYTRNTQFNGEPCEICGGNKLIHGIGRYIIFDDDDEEGTRIYLCGYCIEHLEQHWGVEMSMC